MKISTVLYACLIVIAATTLVVSCKKDSVDPKQDFDRTDLVKNLGNNIILPSYQVLGSATTALDASITTFNANPSAITLADAQTKFKDAYRAWERCAPFGFGPADQAILDKNVNIFPTNVGKINISITNGGYDLNQLSNIDAKGFPALDYMLYGVGADNASILLQYTTDGDASKRKQYLAALSLNVKTLCNTVLNAWLPSAGNYLDTFLKSTGTDVGSAVGQVINGLDYDLDNLKNYKIALPVGIIPSSGTPDAQPLPDKVEAYYSGMSAELALIDLTTLQNIYSGKSDQGDGVGFDDYLTQIKAQYNGGSLNDAINTQFASATSKVQAMPDPLSQTITNSPALVTGSYTELQKLIVLLKTDMPSALGVLITFEDNDGD